MNMKKVGIICGSFCILLAITFMFFRGCSIRKKQVVEGTAGRVLSSEDEYQTQYDDYPEDSEELEIDGYSEEDYYDENANSDSGEIQEQGSSKEDSDSIEGEVRLNPVENVSIVDKFTSSVIVSAKKVYLSEDGMYAYSLKLVLPVDSGDYKIVNYMCSVATWNEVESGENIQVEYGVDEYGNILILSLSRGSEEQQES